MTNHASPDYSRTALVIWPSWSHFDVVYNGRQGWQRALQKLNAITSSEGTAEEREFIRQLLLVLRKRYDPEQSASVICAIARRWEQPTLWNQAVSACAPKGVSALPLSDILAGIGQFSFEAVKKRYLSHCLDVQ